MSHKSDKLAALAALKRARQGVPREYKEEDDVAIYDEVSEEQYKKIVKGRLQRDDFVEDDGVDGYADNGMEDWSGGEEGNFYSDEEMEEEKKKNKAKKKKAKDSGKSKSKAKPPPPPAVAPSFNDYRKKVTADQENDFMSNIFGELDAIPTKAPVASTSRKRKTSPDTSYNRSDNSSPVPYRSLPADNSSDGLDEFFTSAVPSSDDLDFSSPRKRVKTETSETDEGGLTPATQRLAQVNSFDDIDMDAFMSTDDDDISDHADVQVKPDIKPSNEPTFNAQPSWLAIYDSLSVSNTEDPSLGSLSTSTASSSVKHSDIDALETDGSLHFFWIDYLEHQGELFFVGKLKDKSTGAWISCCVTVKNLERNLFVLSRQKRAEKGEGDDEWYDTDEVPEITDVYSDFDAIRSRRGIKKFKGKFVDREYAFGDPDVPRGKTKWMKVAYAFTDKEIPSDAQSPNIAKIFGTNTSAFELLVLKRKIMGPCWIQIKNPEIDNRGVSWCKLEVIVEDPKDFNPFPDSDDNAPKDTPPLNIMSLSIRTIVNHRENKREVVCVTARTWRDMVIEGTTPPEQLPCTVQTFVRPLDRFPPGFESTAKANAKGLISPMKNERMLLNTLLVAIHKTDPDIIVGHDFLGVSLDVLLHRMRDLKADHWSRIGRFRRSAWPRIGKQGTNIRFLSGRMLCDLSSDAAKSMITSITWSLTEMCKSQLRSDREEIDPDDTASYFDGSIANPDRLMTFVRHCELDAHYHMAIASKVQILPLTKQLTVLAGNSWNKTLNGGRAERNEYILLHEFHRLKFICPDKSWGKKSVVKAEPIEDDPEALKDALKGKGGKKDKYKGGLVLDPRKGLWNSYVLVMDFNSLYPSIIQEYNIDFTTIDKSEVEEIDAGEEGQLALPGSEVPQGVLPRIIATLVNRRKQVKSLMKDRSATAAQLLQWDIKQKAYKLTANSMYGCLGFEYSRFYARQLAALTTHMGREILQHTKELAESMQLDVLYGDTDSLFVNSNATELSEALRISSEFALVVNKRYRKLEIDLDAIFQRLLLLQKKKYAAVKVEAEGETSIEVKGLDMKRREYCQLSKNVSQYVLGRILSGEATEIVVEQIHDYLTSVGENVRGGTCPLDEYVINKRLGKNPEDYPKAEGQPHVQVALKMKAKGGNARAGDIIPYVFCLPEGQEPSKTTQSDRARHRDEVRRGGSGLKIDAEYYLSQQILPPVQRLCEEIEGIDRAHLAECLGLDVNKYRAIYSAGPSEEHIFASFDSLKSDKERYKDVDLFNVKCKNCKSTFAFQPLNNVDCCLRPEGALCPACNAPLLRPSLQVQMETQIRKQLSLFYERWVICSDPTCGFRTRTMGVYGRACLRPGCTNKVAFEYSDEKMYTQLRYYAYLFDGARAVKNAAGTAELESIEALAARHSELMRQMSSCAKKYLDEYAWRWVDMNNLFGTLRLK
ncbi:DNA polymerase alpha catalytic subunit [Rhodocollybia butyracea]|uniref:DNA polymerase n=1 Tax=Rhodocollybia butyracea TaxID=206335 RepID=A0A9P5U7R4_9AGAR|nr:DNA polymerase alpha catalytic subunit [Rhodocollybia butyracea]